SQALMLGRTLKEAEARGGSKELAPHQVFTGNRPSLTIAYRKLDPFTLGRLVALYEHRVFVEAAIWGINAFDQWGVELGKELATSLEPIVQGKMTTDGLDSSTAGLAAYLRKPG
ncbi:MAG: glucose-6-phosphate isomerase, partial [Pseudomonadota bacterium]